MSRQRKRQHQPQPSLPKKRKLKYAIKVVALQWNDAAAHEDEVDSLPIPVPALSFGIVVEETDDHVTLAKEIFADGDMRYKTSVPRGMVTRIIPLKTISVPKEFLDFMVKSSVQQGQMRPSWTDSQ